jgi:hypothetical protein
VDILKALPESEVDNLVARLGVRIDPAKRLDPQQQVARALVALPDLRDPSRLPHASVELLHRIAEAKGVLVVDAVPPALQPLAERGLVFARAEGKNKVELVLPAAYLVQLRSWEGEDPRGVRALLAQAPFETVSAIAGHYLGRPATPPIALSLESAWEVLGDPEKLGEEIEKLSPTERRVLEGVEQLGGEVDTEELLELEREPLRLRTASGATPSRRGVGFSLERRGLLVPVHPNRHVVPTEVAAIIGSERNAEREARREQVKTFVLEGDHAPRRAKFSQDPAPLAMALALAVREPGNEVRPGIGTAKSLVAKMGTRFGRDPYQVAMLVSLSRAIGLWDASAITASQPPGSLEMCELTRLVFTTWRRGGAWDEARQEPEVLRLPPDQRDSSASGVVRELVLEALRDLGENRWLPWKSLESYLATDHRMAGIERLLRRWAERVGADLTTPMEVARRIVLESLPALGIIDLGEDDPEEGEEKAGARIALRLTPRGRSARRRQARSYGRHEVEVPRHARPPARTDRARQQHPRHLRLRRRRSRSRDARPHRRAADARACALRRLRGRPAPPAHRGARAVARDPLSHARASQRRRRSRHVHPGRRIPLGRRRERSRAPSHATFDRRALPRSVAAGRPLGVRAGRSRSSRASLPNRRHRDRRRRSGRPRAHDASADRHGLRRASPLLFDAHPEGAEDARQDRRQVRRLVD